ncbi:MAG TPA: hypothetical protein PLE19_02810 [Planctomycetota bacterium]|nr:hypothetical protein [Planctomycetota bacterium]HRR79963.1 hypothetical protein [Planctomycetota bacterium]HRT95755.1 hypothetical protein [Planctomycetota bacterium]
MEWNVAKPQRVCPCGRELAENETYYAALYEQGDDFVRKDYCLPCWEKAQAEGGIFSFWKTTVPVKEQKRRLFADDEVLLDFFFRLEHAQEEQKRQFFYLLGLILMRKKLLKFDDLERADGQEFLLLRYAREDRVVRVPNPRLTEEQIEALKGQLSEILDFQV